MKRKQTHSEKLAASRADLIFLIKGKDVTHRKAWYYVFIDPQKKHLLSHKNTASASFNIAEMGRILYSGYGENPPAEIKKIMLEEYGYSETK